MWHFRWRLICQPPAYVSRFAIDPDQGKIMATIPGSLFRKTLFWLHLGAGVAAGLLILLMSVTGVLLAYEHQLLAAAAQGNRVTLAAGATPLPASQLAAKAREALPEGGRLSLVFDADSAMAVTASRGREGSILLNPYTGEVVPDATQGRRAFLRNVENLHRWLGGRPGSTGADLMHTANLLFLFITVSGAYLWFPAVWRWHTLKGLVLFRGRYLNSKFRDFSWHHVFGVWAVLPLFLIALSGVVMSYPWANAMLFSAYGEEAPQRRGPEGPGEGPGRAREGAGRPREGQAGDAAPTPRADLDTLLAVTKAQLPTWQKITLPLAGRGPTVDVGVELQSSSPRPPRSTVVLDAADAHVVRIEQPNGVGRAQSNGQKARIWFRFVHTGEQYGVVGQTVAALASLAACFLVYTGLALAFRRLILPWFRKRD
jgi:uncharacterized iron-regulated membrane protein